MFLSKKGISSEQSILFWLWTMTSDLELVILICTTSHTVANFPIVNGRSRFNETNRATSYANSRDAIWRPLNLTPLTHLPWLCKPACPLQYPHMGFELGHDENHIAPLESEVQLAAGPSSPALWTGPSLGVWGVWSPDRWKTTSGPPSCEGEPSHRSVTPNTQSLMST